ncbi:MAG: heat shock protein Hsp20 [Acidimicrobiales bacterium]|nr:heat shock protein Hsp20 [Acidimicrobiales bacterium]
MALAVRNPRNERTQQWDPLADIERMLSRLPDWSDVSEEAYVPLADVEETDSAYIIDLELPGVDKSDIDIAVMNRRLTVTGERKEREREGILRRRTRTVGRFNFEIILPEDVDATGVSASMDNGVLRIVVPKAANEGSRHIEVQ